MKILKKAILEIRAKNISAKLIELGYFTTGSRILDIGAGSGRISEKLNQQNLDVTMVDIVDYNQTKLPLIIFDGKKLPFKNKEFDFALLISVIHHSFYQKQIIKEAHRVAKKVIVIEDIYNSKLGENILKFTDWVDNYTGFGKAYGLNKHLSQNELERMLSKFKKKKKDSSWNPIHLWKRAIYVFC